VNSTNILEKNSILVKLALDLIKKFTDSGIEIRILGSIGLYLSCPQWQQYFSEYRVPFSDIDLITRKDDIGKVEKILTELDYEQNNNFKIHYGYQRRIFYSPDNITLEIYLDNLILCQEIDIGDRILIDYPALSPTDLFLSKIQRIGLKESDIFDIACLLSQHELTTIDNEGINLHYISSLCSKRWCWWKTTKYNFNEILNNRKFFPIFNSELIKQKIESISQSTDLKKKSFCWKFRSAIGDKVSWYNYVT
jgi:hypothetical protein